MNLLTDILKEIPTSGVLRERVALAEQKYESLERENETLKKENAKLKGELEAVRRKVPNPAFVEARGVLFKRRENGGYEPDPYCPECQRVMTCYEPTVVPATCDRCKITAPFRQHQIPQIIAELRATAI